MKSIFAWLSVMALAGFGACSLIYAEQDLRAKFSDPEVVRAVATGEKFVKEHAKHMSWAQWNIEPGKAGQPHSGSAEADWSAQSCDIKIDPNLTRVMWAASDGSHSSVEFVLLHELGHCQLYSQPRLGWRDAGFKGQAPDGLLDELLGLDSVLTEAGDRQINYFGLAHEAFADSFAIAWLIERGSKPEALMAIPNARAGSPMDRGHGVADASKAVIRGDWRAKGWGHERAARAAAAGMVLSFRGFEQLAELPAEQVVKIVASGWCNWLETSESAEFAVDGSNYWVGRVKPKGQPHARLAAAIPALEMPKWATRRLYEAGKVDQKSCEADAAKVLSAKYMAGS